MMEIIRGKRAAKIGWPYLKGHWFLEPFFSHGPLVSQSLRRAAKYGNWNLSSGLKMDRQTDIENVANAIFEGFVKGDGGDWLARTGNIIGQPSLRFHKTKQALNVLRDSVPTGHDGLKRFWTKKLMRKAVALMMSQKDLSIPRTSGFEWEKWLKEQVDSLHDLTQKARRNHWRVMDQLETLQYEPQELSGGSGVGKMISTSMRFNFNHRRPIFWFSHLTAAPTGRDAGDGQPGCSNFSWKGYSAYCEKVGGGASPMLVRCIFMSSLHYLQESCEF